MCIQINTPKKYRDSTRKSTVTMVLFNKKCGSKNILHQNRGPNRIFFFLQVEHAISTAIYLQRSPAGGRSGVVERIDGVVTTD